MPAPYNFGFSLPADGDRGTSLFTLLINLMKRLIDHRHDGVDSTSLSAISIAGVTQSISSASWTGPVNGLYSQTVTMPAGVSFDGFGMSFRLTDGTHINPTVTKVSASSYIVSVNDNVNLTVVYLI